MSNKIVVDLNHPMILKCPDLSETQDLIINPLAKLCQKTGSVIAGGYAIYLYKGGTEPGDIDIFIRDTKDLDSVQLGLEILGYIQIHNSENAITYKRGNTIVQVVKSGFSNEFSLLSQFDLSICQCLLDTDTYLAKGKIYLRCTESCGLDLKSNLMTLKNIKNPLGTLRRILKYYARGFKIGRNDMIYLMDQWASLSFEKKEEFKVAVNEQWYNFLAPNIEFVSVSNNGW